MVDTDTFRQVMGNFAAGVTVVTLPDPHHGITVNAFASLSLDPTLVLICIDHDTEAHERLSADADGYCVNVLAGDQQHLGEHFADIDPLEERPFETESTRTEDSGAAVFEESVAYLDCTLGDSFEAGDHTIYVGEVEAAEVLRPDAPALTFFRGEWGRLA
jgi:flavin reductase (DIM6/NTAB) family NADH-FMN oxidoreductase RutF